ncbi:MAG: thiamine pyrophosphate-binding protein [Actinobacteria bacterium]|nr:thiamine pyrophosphate-binding protein [Actinomycetota bacterium]
MPFAPGVGNGVGNIFNAAWNRSPIVVTAGQQNINQLVQEPMLAADLVRIVEQFCKWSYEVRRPEDIGVVMRRAFKIAASPPTGPVFVSIPWNYLDETVETTVPPSSELSHAGVAGDGVVRAAELLRAAERPLIIAGDEVGRSSATEHVVALAELLGARVVGEVLSGRFVFPMDHPSWSGYLAPVNPGIRHALEQADVVLVLGAQMFPPFFFSSISAVPNGITIIQVDPDPYQIAKTYPVELGLRGDVCATTRALVSLLSSQLPAGAFAERFGSVRDARAQAVAGLNAAIDHQKTLDPLPALAAAAAVVDAFDGPTSVVDEAVTNTAAVRAVLRQRDPDSYFFFRGGGLGWGIPAAAGVQLAQPDRGVVAFVGDGATNYVPQSLWTLAHHDIPVKVVVLNNGGYYILKAQLLGMAGKAAKKEVWPGMDIADPPVDFMSLAAAYGVPAERATSANEVTAVMRKAMDAPGPFLVEIPIDRSLKPLG